MWKQFTALLQTVFTLAKDLEQNRNDIKDLRQDITKLSQAVQYLVSEIKLAKHENNSECEKIAMQLQIELLKFEKRLPSAEGRKKKARDNT